MIEAKVEIPGLGAEALFWRPDGVADFPGVLFLTDVWGPRPGNIGMAKRLAERGFAVLMPNVIHRYSPITPDGLETDSADENRKRLGKLFAVLTPEYMVNDGKAYVDFLLAQKGVKSGKIGVVGYCFMGQMAVRIAAAVPDKIAAAASFHGGFQSEVYDGALHGWTTPGRGVYNELQAERAFEKMVELFDATLK